MRTKCHYPQICKVKAHNKGDSCKGEKLNSKMNKSLGSLPFSVNSNQNIDLDESNIKYLEKSKFSDRSKVEGSVINCDSIVVDPMVIKSTNYYINQGLKPKYHFDNQIGSSIQYSKINAGIVQVNNSIIDGVDIDTTSPSGVRFPLVLNDVYATDMRYDSDFAVEDDGSESRYDIVGNLNGGVNVIKTVHEEGIFSQSNITVNSKSQLEEQDENSYVSNSLSNMPDSVIEKIGYIGNLMRLSSNDQAFNTRYDMMHLEGEQNKDKYTLTDDRMVRVPGQLNDTYLPLKGRNLTAVDKVKLAKKYNVTHEMIQIENDVILELGNNVYDEYSPDYTVFTDNSMKSGKPFKVDSFIR